MLADTRRTGSRFALDLTPRAVRCKGAGAPGLGPRDRGGPAGGAFKPRCCRLQHTAPRSPASTSPPPSGASWQDAVLLGSGHLVPPRLLQGQLVSRAWGGKRAGPGQLPFGPGGGQGSWGPGTRQRATPQHLNPGSFSGPGRKVTTDGRCQGEPALAGQGTEAWGVVAEKWPFESWSVPFGLFLPLGNTKARFQRSEELALRGSRP